MLRPRPLPKAIAGILLLWCLAACESVPQRFDSQPVPMGSALLVGLGLHDQPGPWACVDAAHDAYLRDWSDVIADDAAALSERIRALNNPLDGGSAAGRPDHWMQDDRTVLSFARRHASTLRRLEALDDQLLASWAVCLGPSWNERLERLRVDRAIDRWRGVAEARGPAIVDLRMLVARATVEPEESDRVRQSLQDYATRLEPLVKRLAEARLTAPMEANRMRRQMEAAGTAVEERKVVEMIRTSLRPPMDAIVRLDLETLDGLEASLPTKVVARLRTAVLDAVMFGGHAAGPDLVATVSLELPSIDGPTRTAIQSLVAEQAIERDRLQARLVELLIRDPRATEVDALRGRLKKMPLELNARIFDLLPPPDRKRLADMQALSGMPLREALDAMLDPAVASRLQRQLPPPPPEPPARRLPVRSGSDVLAQLLPSDFGVWATARLPSLAADDPVRAQVIWTLARDAGDRWSAELRGSLDRLKPMQEGVERGMRDDTPLAEVQRRLRTAVAELDAARSRLQLIEDPLLAEAAALAGRAISDPAVERLRLERATEFAGLGWRDMPVHTLFRLDRESTIDFPSLIEQLPLEDDSRAIADMALVDSAVPLIESAELLRQSCVQALRGLVLDLKRLQLRQVPETEMGRELQRAVKAATSATASAATTRMELQRELLQRITDAIPASEARLLRRGYWQLAFPEIFLERRRFEPTAERLLAGLQDGGALQAAAEGVLEAREQALDAILPDMVAARKKWPTDPLRPGPETLATMDREAPVLGTLLRLREEIDARALRSLASLHGDDEAAWDLLTEWAAEWPTAFETR